MKFPRKTLAATFFLAAAGISGIASAEMTKMVGGAAMYPSKNIIQNAVHSKDNTTLVAAVKAAGLVDTLQGPGPFTVFAPTNAAFAQLPPGTVDTLLKPENKDQLVTVLTYHVLPGRLTTADLKEAVKEAADRQRSRRCKASRSRLPKKAAPSASPIRKATPPASRSPTFSNRMA